MSVPGPQLTQPFATPGGLAVPCCPSSLLLGASVYPPPQRSLSSPNPGKSCLYSLNPFSSRSPSPVLSVSISPHSLGGSSILQMGKESPKRRVSELRRARVLELGGLCLTPGPGSPAEARPFPLPSWSLEWDGEGKRDKPGTDNTAREKLRS